MEASKQKYERREGRYNELLQKQEKAEQLISNLRLAVFVSGAGAATLIYVVYSLMPAAALFVVFLAMYIHLVVRHKRLKDRMEYAVVLRDINTRSLQRLNDEWATFSDDGRDFSDDSHNYSGDLDIFGHNSLFQWTNTAVTFAGRRQLRDLFLGVLGNSDEVRERQEAVNELAPLLTWRQRFLAEGMIASAKMRDPGGLLAWARERNEAFLNPWVIGLIRLCPAITVTLSIMGFVLNIVPWHWPTVALVMQFAVLTYMGKERHRLLSISEHYAEDLKVYYKMLRLFEKQTFTSPHIKRIKERISKAESMEAFRQVDRLSSIINAVSDRRNGLYIFFNSLTLWDFQIIIALERWKQQSGRFLGDWLDALGRMEALASLAVIRIDNPEWVTPTICDGHEAVFETEGLGHPLLSSKRTYNDVIANNKRKVLLITGSNMSGKSTLLRTTGINLVLAYAGAPVCARSFRASVMAMYTSMRVGDNLGANISSFYAELLRIKTLVSGAKSGERIFFLLDEVFKGTNSLDRHTGAKVLINKLSDTNSVGLVSTHDLELCDLGEVNDKIANYHFQEHYEDGKIQFDYILRLGPSTTRNALYLMRLAGIDVEEAAVL